MRDLPVGKLAAVAILALIVGAVALVVRDGQALPDEVSPIAWHQQPCAHCQMLISEPAHAAQLVTADGEVRAFDDPGCALSHVRQRAVQVHRLWFHHATADRWLRAEDTSFLVGGATPMASGLLAVERGTPGALDLEEATARALAAAAQAPGIKEESP